MINEDATKFRESEKMVINHIRRKKQIESKNVLSTLTGMPWSTVSKVLGGLEKRGIVIHTQENNKERFSLYSDYAYFVGVSFGSSRIKITILDFNFDVISLASVSKWRDSVDLNNYHYLGESISSLNSTDKFKICINQNCSTLVDFYYIITEIVNLICEIKEIENLNICIVNFVMPGNIDFDKQTINNSYILDKIQNISIDNLLNQQNIQKLDKYSIKYMVDHNVNASIIGEREVGEIWRHYSSDDNFMCVYLGYGIGCSYIINGQIYRGNNNAAGQLGHNQVIPRRLDLSIKDTSKSESFCRCGRVNCLEHRIRQDVFNRLSYTTDIKENENRATTKYVDLKTDDVNLIKIELLKQPQRVKLFATYLGEALCNSILNLSINKVILSGKFSALFPLIENELLSFLFLNGFSDIDLKVSKLDEFSAAIGAAIDGYMFYFSDNFKWI